MKIYRLMREIHMERRCIVFHYSGESDRWPHEISDIEEKRAYHLIDILTEDFGIDRTRFMITSNGFSSESGIWVMNFPISMKEVRDRGIPGYILFFWE